MVDKLQILFTSRDGVAPGELGARLASESLRLAGSGPAGTTCRRALRLPDDPTAQTPHGDELGGSQLSFSAVIELGGQPLGTLLPLVDGVAQRLADLIVPEQSAAIAGIEHVIIPSEHPVLMIFALRALPSLTSEEFHDHWLHRHAPIVIKAASEIRRWVPVETGYRQFHADASATREAARLAGVAIDDFEGAALGYVPDVSTFLAAMTRPDTSAAMLADERLFIDHARSTLGLYRLA